MIKKKFDLIVVGAGVLGTFHALHALELGLSVLHLEKDNFPVGSTVRNFGQVVPSGMSGKWFDYAVRGLEIYQSIQRKYDISVRNNGSYYFASDDDECQLIHELGQHYDTLGYSYQFWNKSQVTAKYSDLKSNYVKEAIVFDQELSVEPGLLIHRLHQYMQQSFPNYTLMYDCTVSHCDTNQETVLVTANETLKFEASKVIICNGYEFKILFRDLFNDSGLEISKLQMMKTIPLPQIQLPGNILTGLTIRRYESFVNNCPSFSSISVPEHYQELQKWGIHILFKQGVDGSIIIGDSHEYALGNKFEHLGFQINKYINELMIKEANRILPFNANQIECSWAGFYSQHKNNIVEHDIEKNIHIRTGIGGKGMTASAGYAEDNIKKLFNQ